jgi:cytochrome P450
VTDAERVGAELTVDALSGDSHPHLARVRAASPVAEVPAIGGFLVTGRAAAIEVLRDPETFTVDDPRFSTARVVGPSMLSLDGAAHARHRDPYVPPYRPRQVTERFESFVQAEAGRLVGALGERAELRAELAGPLAAAVVAESLGLDGTDTGAVARLLAWYRDIVASVAGIGEGRAPTAAGERAMAELAGAVQGHLADVHGGLDDAEVIANAAVIMFGGIETTEGMILNALWLLLGDAGARAEVAGRPALVAAAVEESLRMEPAAAVVDRYATRDVTVAGTVIPAGAFVEVSLTGANRDPAEFPEPDRFDLHRANVRRHLAFAAGPHVCIGMDLARLETRIAVATLLAARPDVHLDADAPSPTGLVFRKPARLPVEG